MKLLYTCLWFVGISILVFTSFNSVVRAESASYQNDQNINQSHLAYLQTTVTSTFTAPITVETSIFTTTFTDLGYKETSLNSPVGQSLYAFRIPNYWQIQENNFIEFDLSYNFSPLNTSDKLPTTFGDLKISVDGQTIQIFSIPEPKLDHEKLRVPIPVTLLNAKKRLHEVEIVFDAGAVCTIPHKATLVIHPTTSLNLSYSLSSIPLDLSTYPAPFFQDAFELDEVLFALSAKSGATEIAGAVGIAAKLGDLSRNRTIISTTHDVEVIDVLKSPLPALEQHLFAIGQPQNNQLISFISRATSLPVALKERQMALVTQGPITVMPDQTFSYTFTLTNTTSRHANVFLVDTLPLLTQFLECAPQCQFDEDNRVITWSNVALDPDQGKEFSLNLKMTNAVTGTYLENNITLLENKQGPINVDTFTSDIEIDADNVSLKSSANTIKSDHFFAMGDMAVAETDGIIQLIASPWNESRAILMITGLTDEAIRKASHAMSSGTRFPGMTGAVALVKETRLSEDTTPAPSIEMTFQDLGYEDKVLRGQLKHTIDYGFFIPMEWQLTDEAMLDFRFTHSLAFEGAAPSVTLLLNETPVSTFLLDERTAANGRLQVKLPPSAAQSGDRNKLTVEVTPSQIAQSCSGEFDDFWFISNSHSKIVLDHRNTFIGDPDLKLYPYPFNSRSSLSDLLFILPNAPTTSDLDKTLRLAAALGNSARGQTILPAVALGTNTLEQNLENYNIVALGRPSRNSIIRELNEKLPQPFLIGSDEIEQKIDDIVFRLPSDIDLGYLQLISSPWNSKRAILIVTGTTEESIDWAAQTLLSDSVQRLKGNIALIRDLTVSSFDTRELIGAAVPAAMATAVPEMITETVAADASTSVTQSTPAPIKVEVSNTSQTQGNSSPIWLVPLVVGTVLVVLAIMVVAFRQAQQRRKLT